MINIVISQQNIAFFVLDDCLERMTSFYSCLDGREDRNFTNGHNLAARRLIWGEEETAIQWLLTH